MTAIYKKVIFIDVPQTILETNVAKFLNTLPNLPSGKRPYGYWNIDQIAFVLDEDQIVFKLKFGL